MKYKVGTVIKNICNECYNPTMKIYSLKRWENAEGTNRTIVLAWCECEECGAVDDVKLEEY